MFNYSRALINRTPDEDVPIKTHVAVAHRIAARPWMEMSYQLVRPRKLPIVAGPWQEGVAAKSGEGRRHEVP